MSEEVKNLTCPGCGAALSLDATECEWCNRPVYVSTFQHIQDMSAPLLNKYALSYQNELTSNPGSSKANASLALCYLKLKMHSKALPLFEKAVGENMNDSELYFLSAICLLEGKKAFLANRKTIDRAEEYINAALLIEPKGIYYYLWAYIKYDYFERKYLNTTPTYKECLQNAKEKQVSPYDVKQLFELLNVEIPSCLQ